MFVLILAATLSRAQFLFPESFVMIPLDTNKKYAGSISGSFSQQTQKNIITQLGSRVELARRINSKHVFTIAGNFQLIRNGGENVLGGGYAFARFRNNILRKLYPEFMMQYQWLEVRGLRQKFAFTGNLRYRFVRNELLTLAAGTGLVLEFEKWGYEGVPDERVPLISNPVEVINPRVNIYLSYDHKISSDMSINTSLYHLFRIDPMMSRKRTGCYVRLNLGLTEHVTYACSLRMMYDQQPVVPVDPLWYILSNDVVFLF